MAKYELKHISTDHTNSGLVTRKYHSVELMGDTKVTPNRGYIFENGVYVTEDPEEIKELDTYISHTQVPDFEKVQE